MKCKHHGPAVLGVWACPTCLVELREENEALRAALERLWPALERAMSGMVFTADRVGEVQADMNILQASLKRPNVPDERAAQRSARSGG